MAFCATAWLAICVFGEDGFELADEVGGADDLLAQAAEEFDGARVDHGDVHDVVVGRVLHGDVPIARRAWPSRPVASSCQLEYRPFDPGSESRRPCSMRCISLRGSPSAGMK